MQDITNSFSKQKYTNRCNIVCVCAKNSRYDTFFYPKFCSKRAKYRQKKVYIEHHLFANQNNKGKLSHCWRIQAAHKLERILLRSSAMFCGWLSQQWDVTKSIRTGISSLASLAPKKKKTINKNEKKTVEKLKNTKKFFAFVKQHLQLLFKR